MSDDVTQEDDESAAPHLSRRAILLGAVGGAGVTAAVLAGAGPADAANGSNLVLGQVNSASSSTNLNSSAGGDAFVSTTTTNTTAGLNGTDNSTGGGIGVSGNSNNGYGVYGGSNTKAGVFGSAGSADGVFGQTGSASHAGVYGNDASGGTGVGVYGDSTSGYGVVANGALAPLLLSPASSAGAPTSGTHAVGEQYVDSAGVLYSCTAAGTPGTWVTAVVAGVDNAVEEPTLLHYGGSSALGPNNLLTVYDAEASEAGDSSYPSAVAGWTDLGGTSGVANGVYGYTIHTGGYGVVGRGNVNIDAHGVLGVSAGGYGVEANGGLAPLHLVPAATAGAPTIGPHQLGEIYVDSNGTLYRCIGAGSPGTWVPMYSTVPLASPVRLVDTRNGTGGIKGPLTQRKIYTTADLVGGSTGIPAGAVAIAGTVTFVAAPGDTLVAATYLTVFPGGTSVPNTSNVNADTSGAIASGLTVAFGTGAHAGQVSFWVGGAAPAHALLDAAAYII